MNSVSYMVFTGAEETKEKAIALAKKLKEIFPDEKFRIEPSSALFKDGHYERTGGNEKWNINSQITYYGKSDKPILHERGTII